MKLRLRRKKPVFLVHYQVYVSDLVGESKKTGIFGDLETARRFIARQTNVTDYFIERRDSLTSK